MGFLSNLINKRKVLPIESQSNAKENNIYDEFGLIQPFSAFTSSQLSQFISELKRSPYAIITERPAFEQLWNALCIDFEGFGNNVWNLGEGTFSIYDQNGIKIQYHKVSKDIDEYYNQGRADFAFKSAEGKFIINQNERNSDIFLLFVSEGISNRMLQMLRDAECKSLKIKDIKAPIPSQGEGKTISSIDEVKEIDR